ncbi:MAG: pyridoxamine 5'-phosphate oxidase family protein [Oscillospiraceae bacterium]
MRRTDREITDRQELLDVMARCDVCRLALNDESGYPYVVPLNFGMEERDGTLYLLFHGAMTGTKYDRMERDPRATFEMDCGHMLCTDEAKGMCTMAYESVIGRGRLETVPEAEREAALQCLMAHYGRPDFAFDRASVAHTRVFRLAIESMTGKRRKKESRTARRKAGVRQTVEKHAQPKVAEGRKASQSCARKRKENRNHFLRRRVRRRKYRSARKRAKGAPQACPSCAAARSRQAVLITIFHFIMAPAGEYTLP